MRVGLVVVLPIPVFLVVSPLMANGVITGLLAWTLRAAQRMRRQGEAAQAARV